LQLPDAREEAVPAHKAWEDVEEVLPWRIWGQPECTAVEADVRRAINAARIGAKLEPLILGPRQVGRDDEAQWTPVVHKQLIFDVSSNRHSSASLSSEATKVCYQKC
jgi:hypothetical protein